MLPAPNMSTLATPDAALPSWAKDLRRRYLRGESSQFILHGNVHPNLAHGAVGRPGRAVPPLHGRPHQREPAHVEPRDLRDRRDGVPPQARAADEADLESADRSALGRLKK